MIELFCCQSPNVIKVVIALEEFELPYKLNYLDIFNGKNHEPWFLELNPNGRIPVIVDDDAKSGTPFSLAESGAILIYLAEKHGAFIPSDEADRYRTLQWLMFQMSAIGPMFGQYVYFSRRVTDQPAALDRYLTEVFRLYDVVERAVGERRYLACDEYTIADIATFPWLRILPVQGLDRSKYPNMNRWLAELEARPAIARSMQVLKEMDKVDAERIAAATPDQWDRLFGRGKYSRGNLRQG